MKILKLHYLVLFFIRRIDHDFGDQINETNRNLENLR